MYAFTGESLELAPRRSDVGGSLTEDVLEEILSVEPQCGGKPDQNGIEVEEPVTLSLRPLESLVVIVDEKSLLPGDRES
jgi:hypothetical protein